MLEAFGYLCKKTISGSTSYEEIKPTLFGLELAVPKWWIFSFHLAGRAFDKYYLWYSFDIQVQHWSPCGNKWYPDIYKSHQRSQIAYDIFSIHWSKSFTGRRLSQYWLWARWSSWRWWDQNTDSPYWKTAWSLLLIRSHCPIVHIASFNQNIVVPKVGNILVIISVVNHTPLKVIILILSFLFSCQNQINS